MEDKYVNAVKAMAATAMKDIPSNLDLREATISENDKRMNDFIKYNKNIYETHKDLLPIWYKEIAEDRLAYDFLAKAFYLSYSDEPEKLEEIKNSLYENISYEKFQIENLLMYMIAFFHLEDYEKIKIMLSTLQRITANNRYFVALAQLTHTNEKTVNAKLAKNNVRNKPEHIENNEDTENNITLEEVSEREQEEEQEDIKRDEKYILNDIRGLNWIFLKYEEYMTQINKAVKIRDNFKIDILDRFFTKTQISKRKEIFKKIVDIISEIEEYYPEIYQKNLIFEKRKNKFQDELETEAEEEKYTLPINWITDHVNALYKMVVEKNIIFSAQIKEEENCIKIISKIQELKNEITELDIEDTEFSNEMAKQILFEENYVVEPENCTQEEKDCVRARLFKNIEDTIHKLKKIGENIISEYEIKESNSDDQVVKKQLISKTNEIRNAITKLLKLYETIKSSKSNVIDITQSGRFAREILKSHEYSKEEFQLPELLKYNLEKLDILNQNKNLSKEDIIKRYRELLLKKYNNIYYFQYFSTSNFSKKIKSNFDNKPILNYVVENMLEIIHKYDESSYKKFLEFYYESIDQEYFNKIATICCERLSAMGRYKAEQNKELIQKIIDKLIEKKSYKSAFLFLYNTNISFPMFMQKYAVGMECINLLDKEGCIKNYQIYRIYCNLFIQDWLSNNPDNSVLEALAKFIKFAEHKYEKSEELQMCIINKIWEYIKSGEIEDNEFIKEWINEFGFLNSKEWDKSDIKYRKFKLENLDYVSEFLVMHCPTIEEKCDFLRKVEKINLFKFNPNLAKKITLDKICKDLLGSSEINIDTIYSNCMEMVTDENVSEMIYLYMNSPLKVTKPIDEFIYGLQCKKIKNIFKELKKYKFYATITTQGKKLSVYLNNVNVKYPPKNYNFEKLGIKEFYGKKTINVFIIGKTGVRMDIIAADKNEVSDVNIETPQISIDKYFDLYNDLNELNIFDRNIYNKDDLKMANYNLDLLEYYIQKQLDLLKKIDTRILTKFKNDRFNLFKHFDINSNFVNIAIEYKHGKIFKGGSQKINYAKLNALEILAKNTNILKEKYVNSALEIFNGHLKNYSPEDCIYIYMNSCLKYIFNINTCIENIKKANSNINIQNLFDKYYFYAREYDCQKNIVKGSITANIGKMNCSVNKLFDSHICLNYINFKILEYGYGAVKLGGFRYSKALNKSENLMKFEEILIKCSNSDNITNLNVKELEDVGEIKEFSNPDYITEAQYNLLLEDYSKNYKQLFVYNLKPDNISNIAKFLKKFEKNNYLNANNNMQYMNNNHELCFYNFRIALLADEKRRLTDDFLACARNSDFGDILYIYNNSIIKNVVDLENIVETFISYNNQAKELIKDNKINFKEICPNMNIISYDIENHNFEYEPNTNQEITYASYYFNNYLRVGIEIFEKLGEGQNNPNWILNSISNFIKCMPSRRINKFFYENKNENLQEGEEESLYSSENIKEIINSELLKKFDERLKEFTIENFKSYQFSNEESFKNLNYIYNNTILKMLYTYEEFKSIITIK